MMQRKNCAPPFYRGCLEGGTCTPRIYNYKSGAPVQIWIHRGMVVSSTLLCQLRWVAQSYFCLWFLFLRFKAAQVRCVTPPRRSPQRSARHSKSRRRSRSRHVPQLLYAFWAPFLSMSHLPVHYCMTHQIIDFIDRAAYSLTTIEILGYWLAFLSAGHFFAGLTTWPPLRHAWILTLLSFFLLRTMSYRTCTLSGFPPPPPYKLLKIQRHPCRQEDVSRIALPRLTPS